MENATLVALSGQIALRRKLDVIANNVANLNTDGFKRIDVDFEESFMPQAAGTAFPRSYRTNSFVSELGTVTDFTTGTIELTGNDLNVAINGDKQFFTINTPDGERYTRAGNFQLDSTGRLITPDGSPVQGVGGDITFAPSETDITVATDGTVSSSAGVKGKLKIAEFPDTRTLSKVGANLYTTNTPPQPPTVLHVVQGAIERSNVSGISEMTNLIDVQRAYEQITSIMKAQDDLRGRAIERLGSLTA